MIVVAAVRAAFENLKADFMDARFPLIAGRVAGGSLAWGETLLGLYQAGGRAELDGIDALARFWILRYRGMPVPADMTGAPPGAAFVLAFTAFPYLDVMIEAWELGGLVGEGEDSDRPRLHLLFDGNDEGEVVTAERSGGSWRFDLMPLYRGKARALQTFIDARFGGDFDAFVEHYVAEHDLEFDFKQAWTPLNLENNHGR